MVNCVTVRIDKSRVGFTLFGPDVEDWGGRQGFFSFLVLFGMEVDILLFKDNAGDPVVFSAAGEAGFGNGEGDETAGFRGMRRLYGSNAKLSVVAGILNGFKLRRRMSMSVMRRVVGLVVQDDLDEIPFCRNFANKPGGMRWKFYFFEVSLLVDDHAIYVIVLVGGGGLPGPAGPAMRGPAGGAGGWEQA